ncbi:MAG: c-type cytochrome, partial [Proteobacteria bacterium]|nr:c-type cytochrome [Pseudomonadota bacterium]
GGGAFDYTLAVNDGGMVERGKETYTSTCSPCHGPDGGGVVGPNLTDEFWIHGGTPEKIQALISEGAVEKGMPSWEPVLGLDKVRELTVYVMTLKGTKPVTPKDPQGAKEVTQ